MENEREAKYIDADYLLYGLAIFSEKENGAEFMRGVDAVEKMIEEAEPAPVAIVVRCRDCKHSKPLNAHADGVYGIHCALWRGEEVLNVWHKYSKHYEDYSIVDEDGFCDQGERKSDK